LKPIRTKADYNDALAEVERLWGAKSGTPKGDRLDVLATLIDAYETRHYPMDPPDPIEAIQFRMEQLRSPAHAKRNPGSLNRLARWSRISLRCIRATHGFAGTT
jgi:HTH-type transcriptional regulator/antitoxin HigA